jgi:probable HAF family extracellular repeat protein
MGDTMKTRPRLLRLAAGVAAVVMSVSATAAISVTESLAAPSRLNSDTGPHSPLPRHALDKDSNSEETTSVRGFLRDRRGRYSVVAPPGAVFSKTGGLNNRGTVVGIGYPSPESNAGGFGFVRDGKGRYSRFRVPGTSPESRTVASDINERGRIVGWSDDDRVSFGYIRDRAGRFTRIKHPDARGSVPDGVGGKISGSELRGLNDRGDIVGNYAADRTVKGFVRDRRGNYTTIRPPGAAATLVTGINNKGQIVGQYSTIGVEDLLVGAPRAFVFSNGVYRDITVRRAVGVSANSINDRGTIAGAYLGANGVFHGFVRDRDGDVKTVDHPRSGKRGTAVYSLNDKVELTGAYVDTGRSGSGRCETEPGTLAGGMLGGGTPGRGQPADCASG